MKHTLILFSALLLSPLAALHAADTFLVEDGQPRAEIVISEKPQRSTRLAAQELQDGIQKISSARLPIVTQPTSGAVHVFVGQSEHTERLKVTAEGLKLGAFRMVSGADWLALIGDDTEFTPIEPWAKNNGEIVSGKAQAEWEKITGATWGLPNTLMYKSRFSLPGEIGKQHGMSAAAVFPYFGQRNLVADFAMYLPFVLLYGFASDRMVRVLQGRYPPEDGWMAASMVVLLTSVAFGVAGLVLGEGWDGSVRVGGVAVLGRRGGSVCKG